MADFIVQEDGTSRIELEDSSGFLIREEAGGVEGSASFDALASFDIDSGGEPPSFATWKVGTITVPSGTGSMAITGLGGTPKAVFFFGTNWLTEDSSVTTTGTGLFRGMATRKYDDPGTIVQDMACVIPAGDAHSAGFNHAILMLDTSGTVTDLYAAQVTSFDSDGFTLNWTNGEAGGYKVVYVALMEVANAGGFLGVSNQTGLAFGFKAGASLLHGSWAGPNVVGGDRTQEWYGGGAYPGTNSAGWMGAGLSAFTFPTSASQQYNIGLYTNNPSTTRLTQGGHFTGPFLTTANIKAAPTGGGLTNMTFEGDSTNGGMLVAWDDEDSATDSVTPPTSTGNTTTVSGLSFAPGLVIGYSISDEPGGQGTGGRGAVGFSVATSEGFQWTALVDGGFGGESRGSFQSFQRGFSDHVSSTGVHAGTVTTTEDGFIMETEEDDETVGSWIWHAFGHPTPAVMWIPHIYRREV